MLGLYLSTSIDNHNDLNILSMVVMIRSSFLIAECAAFSRTHINPVPKGEMVRKLKRRRTPRIGMEPAAGPGTVFDEANQAPSQIPSSLIDTGK